MAASSCLNQRWRFHRFAELHIQCTQFAQVVLSCLSHRYPQPLIIVSRAGLLKHPDTLLRADQAGCDRTARSGCRAAVFAMVAVHVHRTRQCDECEGQLLSTLNADAVIAVGQMNVAKVESAGRLNVRTDSVHTDHGTESETLQFAKSVGSLRLATGHESVVHPQRVGQGRRLMG